MSTCPQVTFATHFFNIIAGEEDETNPGCYGKELAHWIATKLEERGVSVEAVIPEDFGWVVMVSRKPYMLWLGCGNTDGGTTEWSVLPVAEPPVFQRIFKRVTPVNEIEKLRAHLAEIVPSIPGVTNIVWN